MQAATFIRDLNQYEQHYSASYVVWYESRLDDFLEPEYEPDLILRKNKYVDWNATSAHRRAGRDVFCALDGSWARLNISGRWVSFDKDLAPRT